MTSDELYRDVLGFIGRFSTDGYKERWQVIDAFTLGGCYWFAYILSARFSAYSPEIVLDWSKSHFACRIDGNIYDITGIVDGGVWTSWDDYSGCDRRMIEEQCIMF